MHGALAIKCQHWARLRPSFITSEGFPETQWLSKYPQSFGETLRPKAGSAPRFEATTLSYGYRCAYHAKLCQ